MLFEAVLYKALLYFYCAVLVVVKSFPNKISGDVKGWVSFFTRILLLAITTVLYCAEIKCLLPLNKKPTELIFVADFVKSITEVHVFFEESATFSCCLAFFKHYHIEDFCLPFAHHKRGAV